MKYFVEKIDWIDCIFIPMDWVNSTTTRIWVKAGSDYESDEERWISHFLEHLAFNWGEKWKTSQELKDFIRDIWWVSNAITWDYRTCYYINSPYEYWKDQIEILWDMLVDALYLDKENESEKDVVVQEIKMQKDNDMRQAYFHWRRFFMWDCSYSRDALWTIENVMWFKKSDFLNYKKSLYTKDNIVIVVAWKIDNKKELENLIWKTFARLPDKKSRELPFFERKFPTEHEKFIEKWINQSRVAMFIPWVSCLSEKSIACDILSEIMKRRLYQRIREELGLCYGINSVHFSQVNYWFFRIETWLKSDRLSFWLEEINEVIDELMKSWITESELNSIKNSKRWNMLVDYEASAKIADFVADHYITLNKIVFPEDRAEEFSNVTMKDVEEILPLLERENRYTFYIK